MTDEEWLAEEWPTAAEAAKASPRCPVCGAPGERPYTDMCGRTVHHYRHAPFCRIGQTLGQIRDVDEWDYLAGAVYPYEPAEQAERIGRIA